MEANKFEICRICLKKIFKGYEEFKSKHDNLLKTLNVRLLLPATTQVYLCSECITSAEKYYEFKTTVLANNHKDQSPPKNSSDDRVIQVKQEKLDLCRFCLETVFENQVSSDSSEEESVFISIIYKCFPEIDLSALLPLLCCKQCSNSLRELYNFIVKCSDSNVIIGNYYHSTDETKLDTFEMLQFKHNLLNTECKAETMIKEEVNMAIKSECNDFDENDNIDIKEEPLIPMYETNSIGGKRYKCNECHFETDLRESISLHFLVHKDDAPQQKCNICMFTTKWKSSLYMHIRVLHQQNVKWYLCDTCSYKTKYGKHLNRHKKIHKRKAYACELCNYKSKSALCFRSHMLKRHGKNISYLPSNIEVEEETFEKIPDLKPKPKKIHKCEFCPYETPKLYHLKGHLLKHKSKEEVELFTCSLCSFESKYKASWFHHQKIHKKNRP